MRKIIGIFGKTKVTEGLLHLEQISWYDAEEFCVYGKAPKGISRESTTVVGSSGLANSFGLYDMHGKVWEWCADTWHSNYINAPGDGSPWIDNDRKSIRLLRGGSWYCCLWAVAVRFATGTVGTSGWTTVSGFGWFVVCRGLISALHSY